MYFRLLLLVAAFSLLPKFASSQQFSVLEAPKPEVGKPCPEFTLTHVTHYSKKEVTLSDFKGKWLFLDFWFTGCSTCITSFPKVNGLQKQFDGKIQFLLVGQNHRRYFKNVEEVYEKLRAKQGLNIAAAYDSVLAHSWGITTMPHIVIVDPNGVVRSITDGADMSSEKIQSLLNGDGRQTFVKKDLVRPQFEVKLTNDKGNDFPKEKILNYSLLTIWNGEKFELGYGEISSYASIPEFKKEGFKIVGSTLNHLYCLAYLGKIPGILKFTGDPSYGKVYPYPVLELNDSLLFEYYFDEKDQSRGIYNYCLRVPPDLVTEKNLMLCMQQDLARAFGYTVVIEERSMPVWELIAKPGTEKILKTKGGPQYYSNSEGSIVAGFVARNATMKGFMNNVFYYLNEREKHPFVDNTGISSNIDIAIDADLTNLQDVKRELNNRGMDVILSKRKMKVLVIREP